MTMVVERLRRMARRALLGGAIGLAVGGVLSLFALVQYAMNGPERFEELGATLPMAIGGYLLMGLLIGVFIGAAVPLGRWLVGAALLGYCAAFVLWTIVFLLVLETSIGDGLKDAIVLATVFGPLLGVYAWYVARRES